MWRLHTVWRMHLILTIILVNESDNYNVHKRDVTRWNMFFNIASAHICTAKMNPIVQGLEEEQNDKRNFF